MNLWFCSPERINLLHEHLVLTNKIKISETLRSKSGTHVYENSFENKTQTKFIPMRTRVFLSLPQAEKNCNQEYKSISNKEINAARRLVFCWQCSLCLLPLWFSAQHDMIVHWGCVPVLCKTIKLELQIKCLLKLVICIRPIHNANLKLLILQLLKVEAEGRDYRIRQISVRFTIN